MCAVFSIDRTRTALCQLDSWRPGSRANINVADEMKYAESDISCDDVEDRLTGVSKTHTGH